MIGGSNLSKSNIKDNHQLNYYAKKLHVDLFIKLQLYAQLHKTERLRALNDTIFSDELQRAIGFESISFSQIGRRLH